MRFPLLGRMDHRQNIMHHGSLSRLGVKLQIVFRAKVHSNQFPDMRKPDARQLRAFPLIQRIHQFRGDPAAVILYEQMQLSFLHMAVQPDQASASVSQRFAKAMNNGVFHQRLKDKPGRIQRQHLRLSASMPSVIPAACCMIAM